MTVKVAIFGCGALGLNYGTRLLEAQTSLGQALDVSLILRRDYDLVAEQGLVVEYGKTNEEKRKLVFTAEELVGKLFRDSISLSGAKGTMDWVLICCKSYSIDDSLHSALLPIIAPDTKIMVIMNGLGVESKFVEWFGSERVYGALSLNAINRGPNPPLQPGPLTVNVYLDLKLEVSHITDDVNKSQLAVDLFKGTKISDLVHLSTNLLRARWHKLCWNLTFAGISVAMGGLTCDVIMRDPSLKELARNVICDVIRVANADLRRQHRERGGEGALEQLDEGPVLEEIWVRTENAGAYKTSTTLDLVKGQPMEMQYLFGVPLQRARELQRQDPNLTFAHLESVVLMVEAMSRLGAKKATLGIPWQATYFSDEVERTAVNR